MTTNQRNQIGKSKERLDQAIDSLLRLSKERYSERLEEQTIRLKVIALLGKSERDPTGVTDPDTF